MPPKPSESLFTDLYQLTMAQAYWKSGRTGQATFSLYFRSHPPNRAYWVCAGLEDVLGFLESFGFSDDDVVLLRSLGRFDDGFLDHLSHIRFSGSVRAMDEGTVFFANEPVIEITAPVIEGQILETFLVNQVHLQCLLATKAARVVHAARDRTVVDFAARRAHGTEAAVRFARASYMVGFAGTSNVLAGAKYGIPTFGTMAHSFVTSYESETDAFRAYAESFPDSSTFLVDTYDTLEGIRRAIEVARQMERSGHALRSIRLDSGDLHALAVKARSLLDEAGLNKVQIFASGGLDEFEVDELLKRGAPIDGFGVGTKVGVSDDAPSSDCVYKLVEYDGRPVLKLSSKKGTLPGPKQVYRFLNADGSYREDIIARADEPTPAEAEPLLAEVFRDGGPVAPNPTLEQLHQRFQSEFARLPEEHKRIKSPPPYQGSVSAELEELLSSVTDSVKARVSPGNGG